MSRGDILVVDDTPANLQMLCSMLTENSYEVRPAISGKIALTAVELAVPDLILLDINMPEMNGFEVCEQLKQDERFADIPIIFISAISETFDKVRAFQIGGVDYITKPFQIEEVLARVALHIRLHTLTEQLKCSNIDLENTLQRLKDAQFQLVEAEKMAALGGLVAGVAHEINTPLGIAITAVTTLLGEVSTFQAEQMENSTQADIEEFSNFISQSGKIVLSNLRRADVLVESFKRVAVDRSRAEIQEFAVVPYLEEILQALNPAIQTANHKILITGDRSILIESEPGVFSQVIVNLIMNSLHHAYPENYKSGSLSLTVARSDESVTLIYADDGCGIPQENLKKIFDPFFTTRKGNGRIGLGLHVTYNAVTQVLQGTIECQSIPNEGSIFKITLPYHVIN